MARYIDVDKFQEELEKDKAEALDFGDGVAAYAIDNIINLVVSQPTADVVPKSEVAREILHDLNTAIHNKAVYPNCQGDYAFVNLKVFVGVLQNMQKKYEVKENDSRTEDAQGSGKAENDEDEACGDHRHKPSFACSLRVWQE